MAHHTKSRHSFGWPVFLWANRDSNHARVQPLRKHASGMFSGRVVSEAALATSEQIAWALPVRPSLMAHQVVADYVIVRDDFF